MDEYPTSYEDSRDRFIKSLSQVKKKWPQARLENHPIHDHPGLSIDWIWAEAPQPQNLIFITTALHGIEGYVGSAMLNLFSEQFLPHLDPDNTGLLLVHAINPWGMKNFRKVNENGVDLNRNFVPGKFNPIINPDFLKLKYLINPQKSLHSFPLENLLFWGRLIRALLTAGVDSITNAALYGQSQAPNGIYFGGTRAEEETKVIMDLCHVALEHYRTIIHLDMHSGYGPRHPMNLALAQQEPLSSSQVSAKFKYPLAQKVTPGEFYAMFGDFSAYYYELRNSEFSDRTFFSCAFEFGTYGDSLLKRIRSLRAMVLENQLHWNNSTRESTAAAIRREFVELYFPSEPSWRARALVDGHQAFEGILRAYGLFVDD
jgi:hypothetical protein